MSEKVGILQHHLNLLIKPCARIKVPDARERWLNERAFLSSLEFIYDCSTSQLEPMYRFLQTDDGMVVYVQTLLRLTDAYLQHNYYIIPDRDPKTKIANHSDPICRICDNLTEGGGCSIDRRVFTSSRGWIFPSIR